MEKNIEITLLYDIYGKVLTEKQRHIFEEYYLYNLSLREIAQNRNISYQGVRDSIKTSEHMLLDLEEKVGMLPVLKKLETISQICTESTDLNEKREVIQKLLKSEDDR